MKNETALRTRLIGVYLPACISRRRQSSGHWWWRPRQWP